MLLDYLRQSRFTRFQLFVHAASLLPFFVLVWDFFTGNLTINPIQEATFRTGKTALVLLVLTLAATPANTLLGFRPALKVRRTLGLYTFFYVSIHFLIFVGLDYLFDPALIYEAIFEKRYALVGFSAALIMLPLAITSTKGWMRRLGRNWKRLHRLVYLAAVLAVIHYIWLVKADIRQPLIFGVIVGLLLLARLPGLRNRLASGRQRFAGAVRRRWASMRILRKSASPEISR